MYISVRFVLQLTKLYLGELKHITKRDEIPTIIFWINIL